MTPPPDRNDHGTVGRNGDRSDGGVKSVQWFPVAETGTIPKKEGRRISFCDMEVALFNLGDEYCAVDNRCPHKQGPLADGIVSGKFVFCPLHSLKINLENGCAASGSGCVKVYPVRIIGEKVYIAFHEGELREDGKLGAEFVMDERI